MVAEVLAARAALTEINNPPIWPGLEGGLMGKPNIHRLYGCSPETESSWQEFLSCTHRDFILEFIELEQAREEAVVSQFLAAKKR